MEKQKTILISQPAAEKMQQELQDGSSWRVEISAFTWCGPAYRLVQTKTLNCADLALTDEASGIQIYAGVDAAEYFDDLEIQRYSLFGDDSLAVKERLV